MSNRIYGTEKVNNIIGLNKDQKYDKVDVFTERTNINNSLAVLYYTELKHGKPYLKQEVVFFLSRADLLTFIEKNFGTYELNNYVPPELKQIFFHTVDFCSVDYYLHDGKPDKNYVALNYREYVNRTFIPKTEKFPKEYEELLLKVVNRSKPIETKNQLVFANTIDVYEKRRENIRENYRRYTEPMSELVTASRSKIKGLKDNKKIVGKLKIIVSGVVLASLLAGGYIIINNHIRKSQYLVQKNPLKNATDINIFTNKARAGEIIEKLMLGKYEEVSFDDLKFVFDFIGTIDDSNYDKNSSFNSYSFEDYFDYLLLGRDNYPESREMLMNLEKMYNNSFHIHESGIFIDKEAANKYIDYVLSLTFMYDTYHSDRPFTTVKLDTQSAYTSRANDDEMKVFDSYPQILKIIILNQLKGLIQHSYYNVNEQPSYYFGATDRNSLIEKIREIISGLEDELYFNCGRNYKGM